MGSKGFGANLEVETVPQLSPIQLLFKTKYGRVPQLDKLKAPVFVDGEKYPSPYDLQNDKDFIMWATKKLEYAKQNCCDITHAINLVRMYRGAFGWLSYKEENKPVEIVIPEKNILDFDYESSGI
jgi:hypothetical protein